MGETRDAVDDAIAKLRSLTFGSKGNRSDYVGMISTEDATVLVEFIDRAKPVYDAHAFGRDEIRYLMAYRQLAPDARQQLENFAEHLRSRCTVAAPPSRGTAERGAEP